VGYFIAQVSDTVAFLFSLILVAENRNKSEGKKEIS
jgi:hypothetical protein